MHIVHEHERHRFVASDGNGGFLGEIDYIPGPGTLTANHTLVEREHRGKGVARRLLDEMAAHARARGLKILPVCSYVRGAFRKNPDEYADVAAR